MAKNMKGPYEVQIPYTAPDGQSHVAHYNAIVAGTDPEPGTPATDITLTTRGGGVDLDTGVNALWTVLRARLSLTILASSYTFWKIPTGGGDPIFVSAGDLITPNGSTGSVILNQQETYTFRSSKGGLAKVTLLDTNTAGDSKVPLPSGNAIAAYVTGPTSWLIARDDGFIIAPINFGMGQNERLWKARNRR